MTQSTPPAPRSFFIDGDGSSKLDLSLAEINDIIQQKRGHLWVDIDLRADGQTDFLKSIANLHPLAVEDAICRKGRPKIEEYPDFLFVVIVGVRLHEETEDPYDLETYDISCFLGPTFAVSVHDGPSDTINDVASRVQKNPELLSRGSDRLAHVILDGTVDDYFPLLDRIDDFVDELEQRVIVNFDESALHEVFSVKRLVLSMRRHVAPMREVFNVLTNRPSALLSPDAQIYFRDIYDHVLRISDSIDTYRDLLSSVLDSYLTQVSNRLGRVTKSLAVIATVSIPFVVISGMWGMNVQNIPMSGHPHAFWWMAGIQLVLGAVLLVLLRIWKLL